jgi:hypothetical protein
MFKKMASDALGLSDIGQIIERQDYDKAESDDYVMHEEGEKIHFLIKSRSDEYCFTNLGLLHLDGSGAVSKKLMLYRLTYNSNSITNVFLETAGWGDADVEIKFQMGQKKFSVDVNKKQLEQLKDLYKSLLKIGELQHENQQFYEYAQKSLASASNIIQNIQKAEINPAGQFNEINKSAFLWMKMAKEKYVRKDFSSVFETFIKN